MLDRHCDRRTRRARSRRHREVPVGGRHGRGVIGEVTGPGPPAPRGSTAGLGRGIVRTSRNATTYRNGEDRRNTVDRGLTQLCEAIQSAPTDDPADLVEHILNANVGPSPRSDDVAILAVTLLPQPPT